VRSGVGHGQDSSARRLGSGGDARGTDAREREAGERKGGPGTIPAYVHQADTLADDHKWVGLHGGHDALCSSAT
jgi:hypothetical protein